VPLPEIQLITFARGRSPAR